MQTHEEHHMGSSDCSDIGGVTSTHGSRSSDQTSEQVVEKDKNKARGQAVLKLGARAHPKCAEGKVVMEDVVLTIALSVDTINNLPG
jgi:hypothetical protein